MPKRGFYPCSVEEKRGDFGQYETNFAVYAHYMEWIIVTPKVSVSWREKLRSRA